MLFPRYIRCILAKRSIAVSGIVALLVLGASSSATLGATPGATPAPAASSSTSTLHQQHQQQQQDPRPRLLTDPVADPKQSGVQWFEPTGHTLRGNFLNYWNKNGGLAQFGYPLTEEFTEPLGPNGAPIMVQYFERNRFEHHPENAGTQYEVLLGTLGREFHAQDPPAQAMSAPATYFPETGHNLSGVFKAYWETHGGLAVHGYPITEEFEEQSPTDRKTYRVQYFERSRFELHPENTGTPYEVLLGQLGTQLSQKKGYPYGWYPQYGHAHDFSWTSGEEIHQRHCPGPECVCTFFNHPTDISLWVTPVGPVYRAALRAGLITKYPQPVVIFGHLAGPAERVPDVVCPFRQYIVAHVQRNPAP